MSKETEVAVLLPSRGRAAQMTRNVTGLLDHKTPKGVNLTVYLAIETSDKATVTAAGKLAKLYPNVVIVKRGKDTTAVEGWNAAYEAAVKRGADWLMLGADDVEWDVRWLSECLRVAKETGAQVIGTNDGHTDIALKATHYFVSREFTEEHLGGVMVPPGYSSWSFDREISDRAIEMGVYAPAYHANVMHRHPEWRTAEMDETYQAGYQHHANDRANYEKRKVAGWK